MTEIIDEEQSLNTPASTEGDGTDTLPETVPGSKTPEGNLSAALREERKKRKDAEEEAKRAKAKLAELQSDPPEPGQEATNSDLAEQVKALQKKELYRDNPELTDKKEEFEEFLENNPKYSLEDAATIFKARNGMAETTTTRTGLERPTAGTRVPPKTQPSVEELANLRKNNPRKYDDMLRSGQIKPSQMNWS